MLMARWLWQVQMFGQPCLTTTTPSVPPCPRVIAYEPVPMFRAFFEYSVHLNDLTSLIDVRAVVVRGAEGLSRVVLK